MTHAPWYPIAQKHKNTLTQRQMNDKRTHAAMRQVLYCLNVKKILKINYSL